MSQLSCKQGRADYTGSEKVSHRTNILLPPDKDPAHAEVRCAQTIHEQLTAVASNVVDARKQLVEKEHRSLAVD